MDELGCGVPMCRVVASCALAGLDRALDRAGDRAQDKRRVGADDLGSFQGKAAIWVAAQGIRRWRAGATDKEPFRVDLRVPVRSKDHILLKPAVKNPAPESRVAPVPRHPCPATAFVRHPLIVFFVEPNTASPHRVRILVLGSVVVI